MKLVTSISQPEFEMKRFRFWPVSNEQIHRAWFKETGRDRYLNS